MTATRTFPMGIATTRLTPKAPKTLKTINMARKKESTIEITRSFSRKLNIGNYQSEDFFCSAKANCNFSEEEISRHSEYLHVLAYTEVMKQILLREEELKNRKFGIKKSADIAKEDAELDTAQDVENPLL